MRVEIDQDLEKNSATESLRVKSTTAVEVIRKEVLLRSLEERVMVIKADIPIIEKDITLLKNSTKQNILNHVGIIIA